MNSLRRLDDRLLGDVNDLARHTGWLHGVILGYATYGLVFFAALMLIALLLRRRGSDRGLAAAGWAALATRSSDGSFPSDHAVMADAAAGLWLASRVLGAIADAAAVLMAFSRVYIAAHYPWDVVAGLAFGALVAVLGWWLLRRPLIAVTVWLRRRPGVRTAFGPVLARA
jgi:membrane-associated phospholipid phosphatase